MGSSKPSVADAIVRETGCFGEKSNPSPSMKLRPIPSAPKDLTRAFTLIELLTVTAIIAVLSAAIFPGVKASMRNAQMNAAMQNARQISIALINYAADFEGAFPGVADPENGTRPRTRTTSSAASSPATSTRSVSSPSPAAPGVRSRMAASTSKAKSSSPAKTTGPTSPASPTRPAAIGRSSSTAPTARAATVHSRPKKGGLWEGSKAIVVRVGGSAELVRLKGDPDDRYLPATAIRGKRARDRGLHGGRPHLPRSGGVKNTFRRGFVFPSATRFC